MPAQTSLDFECTGSGYAAKRPGNSAWFGLAFIDDNKIKFVAMGLKGYPRTVANVELASTVFL